MAAAPSLLLSKRHFYRLNALSSKVARYRRERMPKERE
jgi:hypothetical protein